MAALYHASARHGFWKGRGGRLALLSAGWDWLLPPPCGARRAVWRLCLVVAERMSGHMEKSGFDDTDYSVVVKITRSRPIAWRWEIYRAGRTYPIGQSPTFFRTMAAANKAGKAALKQLLAKLNT